ncbi:MAG: NADP-dependent phosphogluconate dehydrogenase [Clostridia bacterium]|nr:NADP-dependent phosphogluconate dehydrogenase [Clostridia bacterium]
MQNCDIGLIGLAVMGQNLVLNMERNGYTVAVYNRSPERTDTFMQTTAKGKNIVPAYTLSDFVTHLKSPRCVMLMVQAGKPVDSVLEQLVPLLEPGDTVLDGGNSFFPDTIRRSKELEGKGIHFLGTGVSGGEEGALNGPSIMPGGSKEAWERAGEILCRISAKAEGEDCCAYLGTDGAGHYVKMTHNGIEYGDMQLICESYAILRNVLGLSADECADVFDEWNRGELDSYLIEITKNILRRKDPDTGKPMVDVILDAAGQKGTGKWTSQQALDLGIAAPTIAEAVFARCISAIKDERVHASSILKGPDYIFTGDKAKAIEDVRKALYASKICSYAQGFALMRGAAQEYGWTLDFGRIALMWRGGCIIRARFLHSIKEAYDRDPNLPNLLLDPFFHRIIDDSQEAWRRVVCLCAAAGISAPSFTSALSYYDAYRSAVLPADLLQAQRDYFGAHTYKRKDKEGVFHTQWLDD